MAGKNEIEKYEYLFVDIEWNQTPGTSGIEDREPIQIGIVATDEELNLEKSFSRAMRLSSEKVQSGYTGIIAFIFKFSYAGKQRRNSAAES